MSAGSIQLAAIGQQDSLITGKPSVTYFSGMYSRNTPFVLQAYDIPFNGSKILFDSIQTCKIPFKGDIVRGLTLKTDMPYLKNPGSEWNWPAPASESGFYPRIVVDGVFIRAPTVGIAYYSTNLQSQQQWMQVAAPSPYTGPTLASKIYYNANLNKWSFTTTSNITVEPSMAPFWGLDPKNFSNIYADGNINYVSSLTLQSNLSQFTLEQGGWARGSGLPTAEKRAGLYFAVTSNITPSTTPTSSQFQLYTRAGDSSAQYTFFNIAKQSFIATVAGSSFSYPSQGGLIQFIQSGTYVLRGGISSDGAVYSIGIGVTTTDSHPGTSNFLVEHTFSTSSNPTPSFSIPFNIFVPVGQLIYAYIDVRVVTPFGLPNALILTGSQLSIGPLDQFFIMTPASASTGTQLSLGSFNSYPPQSSTSNIVSVQTSNSFSFNKVGTFLITAVLSLQTSVLVSVKLSKGTRGSGTLLYDYTSFYGTPSFPSFDFTLPVSVISTADLYYMDITMQTFSSGIIASDLILGSNVSYLAIVQNTSPSPTASYPENGLQFNAGGTSFLASGGNLPLNTGFLAPVGSSSNFSLVGGNLNITIGGLYLLQAVVCTDQALSSIRFGNLIYPIGVGLLPPYSIGIPYYIASASVATPNIASIGYTTVSGGSTVTVYSNTFLTVGPLASNVIDVYNYVDSVGTWLIKQADLRIGGQLVQSLTGEAIELYNDLYVPYEQQPGLTLLTGKLDYSNVYDPGRTYYTNLPFYFYGNNELSIPVAALDRQDLEVVITFRPFKDLTYISNIANVNATISSTIIVEYGYLSESEVKWMRKNRLEYLITQTQITTFTVPVGFTTGRFDLPFLNPVREIYIVIQNSNAPVYDFGDNGLQNISLSFNGQDFLSRQVIDSSYLQYVEAFNHFEFAPKRKFYIYSFANDPMNPRPTGTINMSRIKDKVLEITTSPYSNPRNIRVYAISYNMLRIENGLAGLLFNFN
jgi:hypothetical protein